MAVSTKTTTSRAVSVLICEDDYSMRETIKALVRHILPHVRFFETDKVNEGIEIVRSRNLDIVITDLHLSATESGESLAELAGSLGLMTILLTGDISAATRHTNLAKNGVYVLAKPITLTELSSVIANVHSKAS